MRRRTMLAALATTSVALTGCLGDGTDNTAPTDDDDTDVEEMPEEAPVTSYFDSESARPECENESETIEVEHRDETREYETAETVPYPDEETFNEVVEFVERFEHAYVTHSALCGRSGSGDILSVDYDVERAETFDWYDQITVVLLLRAGGPTWGVEDDSSEWMAGLAYEGVVYAVDETGAARVDFDDAHELDDDEFESHAPDPIEDGELVAEFD